MSDASTPNRATEPDQSIASSQQSQPQAPPNPAGSALLDATAAAGETTNPQGEPVDEPIASNFSGATAAGNVNTASASTTSKGDVPNQEHAEAGQVHIQNNPVVQDSSDVASEEIQGSLPNTDPTALPIDPATNHQE